MMQIVIHNKNKKKLYPIQTSLVLHLNLVVAKTFTKEGREDFLLAYAHSKLLCTNLYNACCSQIRISNHRLLFLLYITIDACPKIYHKI